MFRRLQTFQGLKNESAFLWGARQTGKSTLLKGMYPKAPYYDLLLSDEYARLSRRPSLLREELLASPPPSGTPVILDEVQKCPPLLDEIQWLMVNPKIHFILCGSSARKLKRSGANLLGGRALRYELYPLVSAEIPHFNLLKALNHGLLPRHYLADNAEKLLAAYLGDYLKEEIAAEALARNIPLFARFLEAAAFSNGEILNYQNIASDCGISAPTVKSYFQILEDTLLARPLPVFRKKPKRRVIQAPKFYFFDVGVANHLLKRGKVVEGSEVFGKAFEHFIFQEVWAHSRYSGLDYPVAYWRTASQLEVDFILGDHEVAVEVKATPSADDRHLRGLRAFQEEYRVKEAILVSQDPKPRKVGNVRVLPWAVFLEELWSGKWMR
jgi:predicted AAA+ superfamily ATPase